MGVANSINSGTGTSGYVLQSQGASSPPQFVNNDSVGGLALLSTQTANNSATSVAFQSVISSTYNSYCVIAYNITVATSAANLLLEYSIDNSTWDTTSGHYAWVATAATVTSSPSFASTGASSATAITIMASLNTATNASFVLELAAPATPLVDCYFTTMYENSSSAIKYAFGGGNYTPSSAVEAIRFITSSGNIVTGIFKMYGYTS
jgi:hypothetical protein